MHISRSRLSWLSPLLLIGLSWTSGPANAQGADALSSQETLPASPQSASQPLSEGAMEAAETDKAYGLSLSLTHFLGFRKEVDPFTVIGLGGLWKQYGYNFSLTQSLTKNYYVYADESELQPADTILAVSRSLEKPFYGFTPSASFSLTLPVSDFSRRQNIRTKPRIDLSLSRSFLDDKLSYTLGTGAQYNISEYTTTKTSFGAGGGSPLREYSWSIDNSVSYKVIEKLTASAEISYVRIKYFDLGYKNRVASTANSRALLNTNYSIDLGASYQILPLLALGGGYSQSDLAEKTGGVTEAYIFDVYTTQWYLSLSTSY